MWSSGLHFVFLFLKKNSFEKDLTLLHDENIIDFRIRKGNVTGHIYWAINLLQEERIPAARIAERLCIGNSLQNTKPTQTKE